MIHWKTNLTYNGTYFGTVDIGCGIFQGDSFSPLLFIVSLIPLSAILRQTSMGYKLTSGHVINHLLYMDDLKLFARTEEEIKSLLNSVSLFSSDIGMSFGIAKCAHVGIRRGKVYNSDGISLPSDDLIKSLSYNETYKYLGIFENFDIDHETLRAKVTAEYKRRIRLILSSELSANNKFKAINTFAIPVIRYTAAIVQWPVNILKELDRKTRKFLCLFRGLHPRSDVDRLYLPRKMGGRGLRSVEDVVCEEKCSLSCYVQTSDDALIIEVKKARLLCESQSVKEFRSAKLDQRLEQYLAKPLHGYYERTCNTNWDRSTTFYWLNKGDLSIESEGFLLAAQEQSLPTRAMASVYNNNSSAACRLCGNHPETVEHLVSGCPKLAGTLYKLRHDSVLKYLHWLLCQKYSLDCCAQWWKHEPPSIIENEQVKILWDFNIFCDHIISARRPDLTVVDKLKHLVTLFDVSIPADKRITDKEEEKITKYQDLRIEIERLWRKKTTIIPVVIGALGAVSKHFKDFIRQLNLKGTNPYILQKSAMLGTASILRKTLQLSS